MIAGGPGPRRPPVAAIAVAVVPALAVVGLLLLRAGDSGGGSASGQSDPFATRPAASASWPPPGGSGVPGATAVSGGSSLPPSPSASGHVYGPSWTLVGAGDIADCHTDDDSETAALIDSIPGTVFTAGDNVYPDGSAEQFAKCYDPAWGRFRDRTRPAVGDHEYDTPGAAGYFDYFGEAAGPRGLGYYDYDVGPWQVVVLNTRCGRVPGGCGPDSPQAVWLRQALTARRSACVVAISGHPRFSSGYHGSNASVRHLYKILYDEGVELLVSGHDHDYERLAPADPEGFGDDERGVRQFVVGTGGKSLRRMQDGLPLTETFAEAYGVLRLTLFEGGYGWDFITIRGESIDSGQASCH